jgi:hypothetical protein
MGVFQDPPKTEGGERRALSPNVDVIIQDLEEDGLLLIVENRDEALHCCKFDFSQCENLKVDVPPRGSEKTDRFKCQIEIPPKEVMNLCHLKVVDVAKGGYDMRYRVAVSKRDAKSGEMIPVNDQPAKPTGPSAKLPAPTGPAAGADRKKLNEFVTLLIKDMDDAYLMFLESEGTMLTHQVTMDFSESSNMRMDPGPDVEKTGDLVGVAKLEPVSRIPLARLAIIDDKEDANLKYKVSIKPLEK